MLRKLLTTGLVLASSISLSAQIPNGGFELWENQSVDILTGCETSSLDDITNSIGQTCVKTTDKHEGNFAVRMTNSSASNAGYFIKGDFEDPSTGFKITGNPRAFNFWYKGNIPTNDTCMILLVFGNSAGLTEEVQIKVTGSKAAYTQVTFPLSLSFTPDSFVIAAASANPFTQLINPATIFYIDDMTFTGATASFNGDFENWTNVQSENPTLWSTDNLTNKAVNEAENVFKTTDKYSGQFAAQITTDWINGYKAGTIRVTHPITRDYDTLAGYYKYISNQGADSAFISLFVYDSLGGTGTYSGIFLPPVSTYTYFEFPYFISESPLVFDLRINSYLNSDYNYGIGNKLYIDNLWFKRGFTLASPQLKTANINAYPNPSKGIFTIDMGKAQNVEVNVTNIFGQSIYKTQLDASGQINLSHLKSGTYIIRCANNEVSGRTKIIIN